jgi:1-acyl-sn-glycerol-3-phosphate acyltransferase
MVREAAQQALLFPATRFLTKPTVIGARDLIHAPQPAILAPNHESDIDTPLILLALPHAWRMRTVVGAASDRWYRKPAYGLIAGFWINTFPFDRGGGQRRGLAAAAAHLRDGRNVLLFPQGTRGAGPEGYRAGVAELALAAGVPIVPVHITGSALVMPKGRGVNRRARTTVTFARPLQPRRGDTAETLTARLRDEIERVVSRP